MNMIRTTVAIREDIYDSLKRLAVARRMSFNEVVNAKLAGTGLTEEEAVKKAEDSRKVFERLAKLGKPEVDVVTAIRELRDG